MPDQKYNTFISYAWVDNQLPVEENRGWVGTFVYRLHKYLAQELPREIASDPLWLDYEKLRGSDNISDKIREKLRACRLLLPVLSKGWAESPWCQQELETFVQLHGHDSGRIFPVWMSPVEDLPPPLDALLKYRFWYDDEGFCCVNFRQAESAYIQAQLGCQRIELLCGGQLLPVVSDHLAFLDHVHELDSCQRAAS